MTTTNTNTNTNTRRCECGRWTGEACALVLPRADLVRVEIMPEWLRDSHEAAGNDGCYPANGAERALVSRECAAALLNEHDEWARIVG